MVFSGWKRESGSFGWIILTPKPLDFWQWLISEVRERYPDVIFFEAFTRPKVMYRLAKLGFSQSYTYFTWRNTKAELIEYFEELSHSEYPNFPSKSLAYHS